MMNDVLEEISNEFSKFDGVKAVVLSGSRTNNSYDEKSDYDIYVYSEKEIPLEFRKNIAKKYAQMAELNNQFFETGDELILKKTKACLDIMYRSCDWIENQINNTWINHYTSVGYSTCFLHNVNTSQILFEKQNWFSNLQEKLHSEYPQNLAQNIIAKNLALLKDKMVASYIDQIKKALLRNDFISVNHRISAFLASYFDILFALNRIFHPGEKRLLDFALKNCKTLPADFESDITKLFNADYQEKLTILENMVINLKNIIT